MTDDGDARKGPDILRRVAGARTLVALEGNAAALQRRLPRGWELAPYAGDDLRGTVFRGADPFDPERGKRKLVPYLVRSVEEATRVGSGVLEPSVAGSRRRRSRRLLARRDPYV
jgi:hypothetical protein